MKYENTRIGRAKLFKGYLAEPILSLYKTFKRIIGNGSINNEYGDENKNADSPVLETNFSSSLLVLCRQPIICHNSKLNLRILYFS